MPDAVVENQNADPNAPGKAPQGQANAGQGEGQSGGGGGDEYSNLSQEDLIKKLKESDVEKNSLRSMNDKRFNDMSDKFGKFVDSMDEKEKAEKLTQAHQAQGSTRDDWNEQFKKDPLSAFLLLLEAKEKSRGGQTDETLVEVKRKHLAEKHMGALKEPAVLKHKDEVVSIMNELNLNPGSADSVKVAWDIWKGRNAQSFLDESRSTEGSSNNEELDVNIHDQGNNSGGGTVDEPLSDEDKVYVKAAIERGVFKDYGDFKKFSGDMAGMKRGSKYGGVIVEDD